MIQKLLIIILLLSSYSAIAQQSPIQYSTPNNRSGINAFETTKEDSILFTGIKVRLGGNFTQDFQSITHENKADFNIVNGVNTNKLIGLKSGFNLAMANLNVDAQLEDGIRLNLTLYLSSRHHHETWVKGGYIQFDKLAFLKSEFIDKMMKNLTIKIGDFEVDYGDQHFRRSDGGNAFFNPFAENYIMDQFATEIGGEITYHHLNGFLLMVGATNGELNPTVVSSTKIDTVTGEFNKHSPAFHAKVGYDHQCNENLRVRLTASVYAVKSSASNTLYSGDRTGSHYFFVMENTTATSDGNFRSGRFNPQYSDEVTAFIINPFVKFKGIELFGSYELSNGRMITEVDMRTTSQYSVDLIFRFPREKENFWIGGRYNSVTSELPAISRDITINRFAGTAGWFITNNIMLKAEYVNQNYENFKSTDIRSGGEFDGLMVQASVAF